MRRALSIGAVALATLLLAACGEQRPPERFTVTVEVRTDGAPLTGVEVLIRGRLAQRTDASGAARLSLAGREGLVVPIEVRCPAGTRGPAAPFDVVLRSVRAADRTAAARGVVQSVECPPEDRTIGVVVRSNTPNVPVLWQGREVARTDAAGVALMSFHARPATQLRLAMATADLPAMRPENPSTQWVVPDADDAFVWNVDFRPSAPAAPPRRGHRRSSQPQRRWHQIIRIH